MWGTIYLCYNKRSPFFLSQNSCEMKFLPILGILLPLATFTVLPGGLSRDSQPISKDIFYLSLVLSPDSLIRQPASQPWDLPRLQG